MKKRAKISTNLGETLSPEAVWSKKAYESAFPPAVGADLGLTAVVPALFYMASLALALASIDN